MTETVFVIKKVFVIMMGLNSPMLSAELGVKYDKIDHTVSGQLGPKTPPLYLWLEEMMDEMSSQSTTEKVFVIGSNSPMLSASRGMK